jgi:nitroimidazol reductase NimA-like FMN-containing flavoprotein (pyridoxamine 5'-phosphate oxidase superfamily)
MDDEKLKNMEKNYNKKLERNFLAQMKGNIRRLSDDELRERIIRFLNDHTICTLATCTNNIPRATPVRYRSQGLDIFILTEGGGKLKNIMENQNVSVSITGDYSGFQSVTGLQLWGIAEIIKPRDGQRYDEAWALMRLEEREDLKTMKVKAVAKGMCIIKITVQKARFLCFPEGILNQTLTVSQ